MTDVLLIQPPVSFKNEAWKNDIIPDCPPLGLLYLAATAEKTGYSVQVLDAIEGSYSLQDILETVKREQPKVVGINRFNDVINVHDLDQLILKILPQYSTIQSRAR